MAKNVKIKGWIQREDGMVPIAPIRGCSITAIGLVVGMQVKWNRSDWEVSDDDMSVLQLAIPPQAAREFAQGLLEAAQNAEAEGRA